MLDHVMEFIEAMLCSHNDKPLREDSVLET